MTVNRWMSLALEYAKKAGEDNEVPVGAVVVKAGELVAGAGNQMIARHDPTAHAEVLAVRAACKALGNYRLPGCSIYVTLEPCLMCAGAMLHARIDTLHFAASDPKTGAVESVYRIFDDPRLNHKIDVVSGELAGPSSQLLSDFFGRRR